MEDPFTYACAMYLTKKIKPFELVDHVHRTENEKKPTRFMESYQRLLNQFTESVERIGVNLKCPITMTRIKYPYRGVLCDHFQTFDLETYITINEKSNRWLCPVCGKKTVTLRRCPLTEQMLIVANQIYPMNKYNGLNREGLVDLLVSELQNYQKME